MRQHVENWIKEAAEDGCFFDDDEIPWGPFFWKLYERRSAEGWKWRSLCGYEIHVRARHFPTWAHLMADLRAFKSISEARRQGWKEPVVPCERKVRINGHRRFLVVE